MCDDMITAFIYRFNSAYISSNEHSFVWISPRAHIYDAAAVPLKSQRQEKKKHMRDWWTRYDSLFDTSNCICRRCSTLDDALGVLPSFGCHSTHSSTTKFAPIENLARQIKLSISTTVPEIFNQYLTDFVQCIAHITHTENCIIYHCWSRWWWWWRWYTQIKIIGYAFA